MLENTVWRQYHQENDFREILSKFANVMTIDMIMDDKALYSVIKAKLTKKELKLLAMDTADKSAQEIKSEFDYSDEELETAKFKLYKKLKQDKFRMALLESSQEEYE
jgi:hypothetical protein